MEAFCPAPADRSENLEGRRGEVKVGGRVAGEKEEVPRGGMETCEYIMGPRAPLNKDLPREASFP